MKLDNKSLLFYDVEVFKHNSMVVFTNYDKEIVKIFSTDVQGLDKYGDLVEEGYSNLEKFIKDETLVGFNNHYYDDYMLKAFTFHGKGMFNNAIIKKWNDKIIQDQTNKGLKKIDNITLDTFKQLPQSPGLKKIEANKGVSIIESEVDFNIDRPLTPEENLETLEYCIYDTLQTVDVYKMREGYFQTKFMLANMVDRKIKERSVMWNTTTVVSNILKPKSGMSNKVFLDMDFIENYVGHIPGVMEMWNEIWNVTHPEYELPVTKVVHEENGVVYDFGWGGLHGVPKGNLKRENVKLADVTSMYPSILILFRGIKEKTRIYSQMKEDRVHLKVSKDEHDQMLNEVYKLILNSFYGGLNDKYSRTQAPRLAYSITLYGQTSLYTLASRLSNIGAEVINVNTDGVAYIYDGTEDEKILKEWEEEFKLELEVDYFDLWYQKDVNNYIAIIDKDKPIEWGNAVMVGGDVNRYLGDQLFTNNNNRIVQMAMVDYLINNVPVMDTITSHLDNPRLYMMVLNTSSKFIATVDQDMNHYQKVNRVFATKDGTKLYKLRETEQEDGTISQGLVNFPNAPEQMYIYNGELKDFKNFKEIVDLQYYYDLAMDKISQWEV